MDVARGGHIEPDDDPVQAVLREIEEETGLLAEIIPIHQSVSFTYPEQLPARLYNHRSSAETSGRQRRRGDSHRTTSPSAPAHHNVAPDSPAGFADTTRITMLTGPFGQCCTPLSRRRSGGASIAPLRPRSPRLAATRRHGPTGRLRCHHRNHGSWPALQPAPCLNSGAGWRPPFRRSAPALSSRRGR